LSVEIDGERFRAPAGSAVLVPRGCVHGFAIEEGPARLLVLVTPAGLEGLFLASSEPAPSLDLPPARPTPTTRGTPPNWRRRCSTPTAPRPSGRPSRRGRPPRRAPRPDERRLNAGKDPDRGPHRADGPAIPIRAVMSTAPGSSDSGGRGACGVWAPPSTPMRWTPPSKARSGSATGRRCCERMVGHCPRGGIDQKWTHTDSTTWPGAVGQAHGAGWSGGWSEAPLRSPPRRGGGGGSRLPEAGPNLRPGSRLLLRAVRRQTLPTLPEPRHLHDSEQRVPGRRRRPDLRWSGLGPMFLLRHRSRPLVLWPRDCFPRSAPARGTASASNGTEPAPVACGAGRATARTGWPAASPAPIHCRPSPRLAYVANRVREGRTERNRARRPSRGRNCRPDSHHQRRFRRRKSEQ
jgi:hypothetical protein